MLLEDRCACVCEHLEQSRYMKVEQPEVELVTYKVK